MMMVTFAGGLYFFCKFFFPREWGIEDTLPWVTKVTMTVMAMAVGVGAVNLVSHHLGHMARNRKGWANSLALLVSIVVMFGYQVLSFHYPHSMNITTVQHFLFQYVYLAMDATTFSLLGFYMASAAYRAFRLKSREAALMMTVSLLVMLGQIPLGQRLTSGWASDQPTWHAILDALKVEHVRMWIMSVWNVAAQRGIAFAALAGGIAFSLRIWFSLERGSFFEDK